jgi:hypothetical protein
VLHSKVDDVDSVDSFDSLSGFPSLLLLFPPPLPVAVVKGYSAPPLLKLVKLEDEELGNADLVTVEDAAPPLYDLYINIKSK